MPIKTQQQVAPTGNALTDSSTTQTLGYNPADAAAAINAANQSSANVASDCLWPPSGQFSVPIIPGLYTQSFQFPCLVTYSEARALVAVGLAVGGIIVITFGINLMAAVAVGDTVLRLVTGGGGGKAAAGGAAAGRAPVAGEGVALAA